MIIKNPYWAFLLGQGRGPRPIKKIMDRKINSNNGNNDTCRRGAYVLHTFLQKYAFQIYFRSPLCKPLSPLQQSLPGRDCCTTLEGDGWRDSNCFRNTLQTTISPQRSLPGRERWNPWRGTEVGPPTAFAILCKPQSPLQQSYWVGLLDTQVGDGGGHL